MKSEKPVRQLTEQEQFQVRLFFQRKEVEEHKYYLSQQHGFDVGLNKSAADWVATGQAERFARDFSKNEDCIFAFCTVHCGDKGCNISCALSMEKIHNLMDD